MTVKLSTTLTEAQHAFATEMVATGRFASVDAVLQHGVDFLRQQMDEEMQDRAALKRLLAERKDSKTISSAEMGKRLKQLVARKRRAYALQG